MKQNEATQNGDINEQKAKDSFFGEEFITKSGIRSSEECLEGIEIIGLYFGALWAPNSHSFVPFLVDIYNETNKEKKLFEIIFISLDTSEQNMMKHYSNMPWLALKQNDPKYSNLCTMLRKKDKTEKGIPHLSVLMKTREVITDNGRVELLLDEEEAPKKWLELVQKKKAEKRAKEALDE